jgi:hypothetical protein
LLVIDRRQHREDEAFFVDRLQDSVAVVRQYAVTGIIMLSQCYVMNHLLLFIEPLRTTVEKSRRIFKSKA